MSRPEKRVAVFATEPVTGKIGGLGVRQLEVARELSRHFEVRLLTPFKVGPHNEPFPVKRVTYEQPSTLTPHIKWADSVYSISLSVLRVARRHNKPVAADLLTRRHCLQYLLAGGLILDLIGKVFGYFIVNVGIYQRPSYIFNG